MTTQITGIVIIPTDKIYAVMPMCDASKKAFPNEINRRFSCYTKTPGALCTILTVCLMNGINWRIDKSICKS
jgi:hypothetical protein